MSRNKLVKKIKFATCLNCMDGRVQEPVIAYIKNTYQVDFIDMITEAGHDKILADYTDKYKIESIKFRSRVSIEFHNSKLVAIVGHFDCAGNMVDSDIQIECVKIAIKRIKSWKLFKKIIGLYVDENWHVVEIHKE